MVSVAHMSNLSRIKRYPVYRFSMPVIDSSMYLVPADGSCLVVDPCISEEAGELLRNLGIRECLVLLTHEHYDHISGVNWLRKRLPCQVVCSACCAQRIEDPQKNLAAYFKAIASLRSREEQREIERYLDPAYSCQADRTYTGRLELPWAGLTLTLRETPGHSPGSQVAEIGEHWYFTGDSLIPGTPPAVNLPGSNRKRFTEETRPYLETIPRGSVLFPGHGPETLFDGEL